MRSLILAAALAAAAQGGTITGVVLEHASGRPLARSVVRLDRVPEAGESKQPEPMQTRAGRAGQFGFNRIPPGLYIVTALRTGYFPASYGQRLPSGRGTPIRVTADSAFFAELRARHRGAVTGRVLDENGVGTTGVPVVAYRAQLPLRAAGSAVSDDRGVYRIHNLEPGKYWIRSGGHTLEDGTGWLPTFGPGGREVRDAKIHQVMVDADTAYADVSPESGPISILEGFVTCDQPLSLQVSLSSETAQYDSRTECSALPGSFHFAGLASTDYQLLVTSNDGAYSALMDFALHRSSKVNVSLSPSPVVDIQITNGSVSPADVKLIARRQNLSETAPAIELPIGRRVLPPGYWEFSAHVPNGYYVKSIGTGSRTLRRTRKALPPSDAFEVFIEPMRPTRLNIDISDQGGGVSGRVAVEGKPVAGVPVFLWPVDEAPRRSLMGARERIADTEGNFSFDSLPPGEYRLLATFDASEPDADLIELSRAPAIKIEAAQSRTLDLTLWVAPW
jgi:protocatechuate 3,4-dioxygenase beta subunit